MQFCEKHSFHRNSRDIFTCVYCGYVHECTTSKCDSIFLSAQNTYTCGVTGKCFEQVKCDKYESPGNLPEFINQPPGRRSQQDRNAGLSTTDVEIAIQGLSVEFPLNEHQRNALVIQVVNLWQEMRVRLPEIHRKDKNSVILAVMFSLSQGLCNDLGHFVVYPVADIIVTKLNKKKQFENGMEIKMIRHGQKLIRKAFSNSEIRNPVVIR